LPANLDGAALEALERVVDPSRNGDSSPLPAFAGWLEGIAGSCRDSDDSLANGIAILALLRDRRLDLGSRMKRSTTVAAVDRTLYMVLRQIPGLRDSHPSRYRRIDAVGQTDLRPPATPEAILVIDARGFPAEGDQGAARLLCRAHQLGWRHFVAFDWQGGRFAGCGLGPNTRDVQLDVFGDPGDYLGSGLDGGDLIVHGDAQDQVGQILKNGRLVIHGDVGQTFLYGAKGGTVYVLGSAAGRPLINAVGRPRAVINGTCLDYLAESFMAGDPLEGGGFVVLNGIAVDDRGRIHELDTPYPGNNLFSLASGGAIYLRDPRGLVEDCQLNGGHFTTLSDADWALVEPYLRENEALFGIPTGSLLSLDGVRQPPNRMYRKIEADH
ncbi:MAG: glutamate synthase, partial [Pseudomonadota bacterium]